MDWYRRLDFLPPLGLQVAVGEGDLELYHCYASVSVKETSVPRLPKTIDTEFGTMNVNPSFRNRVTYEMGQASPRNGINPIPQRELLDDIVDNLGGAVSIIGDMPDVVIKQRGVVEQIPTSVEDLPTFEGSEYVFYNQAAHGNFVRRIRQALGIRFENPYRFIKSELLARGILAITNDPVLRKLRSTLKTGFIVTDTVGWSDLGPSNILTLEQSLIRGKWWTDVGEPTEFQIPVDSGFRGQIYRLMRRNLFVVV